MRENSSPNGVSVSPGLAASRAGTAMAYFGATLVNWTDVVLISRDNQVNIVNYDYLYEIPTWKGFLK